MKKQQKNRNGGRRSLRLPQNQQHPKGWVPIQAPPNLAEMFQHWSECKEPNVGWCLMCDSPIRSADDLIPGTSSHNCETGRALDEKIRAAEQGADTDQKLTPTHRQRER